MSIVIDPAVPPPAAREVARLARHTGVRCVPPGQDPLLEQGDGRAGAVANEPARVLPDGEHPMRVRFGERSFALPRDELALALAMAPCDRGGGRLSVVTGVCGGLGASTLAAMLAASSAEEGESVALVDPDPTPGVLAGMLALEDAGGLRWADIAGGGPFVAGRLVERLPQWRGVRVLTGDERGGVGPDVAAAAVRALGRGCAHVVADVPRHAWAAGLLVPWEQEIDELLAVVGSSPEALAAVPAFRRLLGDVRPTWVLRHTSRAAAPAWLVDHLLPEGIVEVHHERGVADAVDAGEGPWPGRRSRLRRTIADLVRRG